MTTLHAIVLRSSLARGGMVIAPSFTDTHGRISIALYKSHGANTLTPFSLIEAELSRIDGDFALAKRVSVLDTYAQARMAPDGAKTLIYLRSILEHCLPHAAPAKAAWEVTTSLLTCLPSFKDWKTAPFLLATLFFEQEGVSKEALIRSKISDQAKETALHAFAAEKADWINLVIPDDLFQATFELIGIDIYTS